MQLAINNFFARHEQIQALDKFVVNKRVMKKDVRVILAKKGDHYHTKNKLKVRKTTKLSKQKETRNVVIVKRYHLLEGMKLAVCLKHIGVICTQTETNDHWKCVEMVERAKKLWKAGCVALLREPVLNNKTFVLWNYLWKRIEDLTFFKF
jgi:hypothetical protein